MRDIVDHRYRIERKLAAGGFGAIYRATDLQVGRPVALKVLHRELAGDASVVARFRREAAALAKLKSPHTVTIYDIGGGAGVAADDSLYLVMELLRGESLQDLFERGGPLPWRRVAKIARGVCSSLREAHAAGIIHRDLKPANIFLEQHALDVDFVKVLDFGIAKIVDGSDLDPKDLTRHGQMIGTFDYMAPEQMLGGKLTDKSDVFTLGVVMHEMISGRRPFGEPVGPAGMLAALLTTTPEPLRSAPLALAQLIARCLDREAAARPDAAELDEHLAQLIELSESIGALGTTPPPIAEVTGDLDDGLDDAPTVLENTVPAAEDPDLRRAAPRPATTPTNLRRTTLPRGSAQPLHVADSLAVHERTVSAPPVVIAPLVVRLKPTTKPPPPRARLAAGTSPIVNEWATHPVAPESTAVVALRWLAILVALFGVGFLAVLTIASL